MQLVEELTDNGTHLGSHRYRERPDLVGFFYGQERVVDIDSFEPPLYWSIILGLTVLFAFVLNFGFAVYFICSRYREELLPMEHDMELPIVDWPLDEEWKREREGTRTNGTTTEGTEKK